MKRLLIFLTFLAVSGVAYAGDPTTEFLEAPFVTDSIALSSGPAVKPVVQYTIDSGTSTKDANGQTFRSNGQIDIRIKDFNPLKEVWTVDARATPDANFVAIQAFLADLKTLQNALPQPPAPPAGAAAERLSRSAGEDCVTLYTLTTTAYNALHATEVTGPSLRDVVAGATGHQGVDTAATTLSMDQSAVNQNIVVARTALASIRTLYSGLQNHPSATCSEITAQILVDYVEVSRTADQIIIAKETLSKQIGDLVKTLQTYRDPKLWRGDHLTDFVIKTVTPTFADQQSVTATAKVRTVTLGTDNSLVVTTDDANAITASFTVRKNSIFAAERAAAVIYNNLKYPQYGTATNASGATVVQRTMDHQPVNGALMLNLVMRLGTSPSVAYPFLQFGVSSAKDFPGVLAGLGLRFAQPFNFSISAGGMITRYKDLDGNLKIGDVVTGTDDINKHLVYKTSPVVLYGAMQLKF
jgi:hypothetical protein